MKKMKLLILGFEGMSHTLVDQLERTKGESFIGGMTFHFLSHETGDKEKAWEALLTGIAPNVVNTSEYEKKYIWHHTNTPYTVKVISPLADCSRKETIDGINADLELFCSWAEQKEAGVGFLKIEKIDSDSNYEIARLVISSFVESKFAENIVVVSDQPDGVLGVFGGTLIHHRLRNSPMIKAHDFLDMALTVFGKFNPLLEEEKWQKESK